MEAELVVVADLRDDLGLSRCHYDSTSDRLGDEGLVAVRLELLGELRPAFPHDTPVDEDVHEVGLDVVEDPLVVRDDERAHLGADEVAHAARDDPQRVDVEAGVGLVEHRDPRGEHRHLEDLDALLLAAGEAVVQVAPGHLLRHLELLHRSGELLAELGDLHRVVLAAVRGLAHRVDRGAQEAGDRHARNGVRVLEGEEEAALRALVRPQLQDRLAVEEDVALGDLVRRVAHERVGEGRLAGPVRAHDRVHLVRVSTARSRPRTISVPSSVATCRFLISRRAMVPNCRGEFRKRPREAVSRRRQCSGSVQHDPRATVVS